MIPNTESIKKAYPYPMKSRHDRGMNYDYCVGGAFIMFMLCTSDADEQRFPSVQTLKTTLMFVNNNLSMGMAYTFATTIIDRNDEGHFEAAWNLLEQALSYGVSDNA